MPGRVFAISDVHADFAVNLTWINALSKVDFKEDCLIIAGDISDNMMTLRSCLESFVKRFEVVFFTHGNHDVWTRGTAHGFTHLRY